ncbi:MAG TPA: DNA-binding protein [Synergistales bacterium]|nr:DNA-binding protein [Synergistales bacterium]
METERVSSAAAEIGRTILVRLAPGEDVFEGLRTVCERHGLRSGRIATMIGSLRAASLVCVTPDPDAPGRVVYLEPRTIEGPLELIAVQGVFGWDDDKDELSIHLHAQVAGEDLRPFAGHLADTGKNRILATAEIVLDVFEGAELRRSFDEETGFTLFKIFPKL